MKFNFINKAILSFLNSTTFGALSFITTWQIRTLLMLLPIYALFYSKLINCLNKTPFSILALPILFMLLILIFYFTLKNFLKTYKMKKFYIIRNRTLRSDLYFISTWLIFSFILALICVTALRLGFNQDLPTSGFISILYIIPVIMLKLRLYGFDIRLRKETINILQN